MRILVATLFVLVGLINFMPVIGVLGTAQLETLYGQSFVKHDLLLLMRHRAVLFGLLGGLIIFSAFRSALRDAATAAGLFSMASFCWLALPLEVHNQTLQQVFWIDAVAILLLLLAWWLSRRYRPVTDGRSMEHTSES
jgi:hypothetical protein